MYDDHLRLIEKRVVDFLLVLIDLFSPRVTAEALRANIGSKSAISLQRQPVDPKFQVEGAPTTNFFSETMLTDLSYGIKNRERFFFRSVTIQAFYRQTDGRTDTFLATRPPFIQCSAVKIFSSVLGKSYSSCTLHGALLSVLVHVSFSDTSATDRRE